MKESLKSHHGWVTNTQVIVRIENLIGNQIDDILMSNCQMFLRKSRKMHSKTNLIVVLSSLVICGPAYAVSRSDCQQEQDAFLATSKHSHQANQYALNDINDVIKLINDYSESGARQYLQSMEKQRAKNERIASENFARFGPSGVSEYDRNNIIIDTLHICFSRVKLALPKAAPPKTFTDQKSGISQSIPNAPTTSAPVQSKLRTINGIPIPSGTCEQKYFAEQMQCQRAIFNEYCESKKREVIDTRIPENASITSSQETVMFMTKTALEMIEKNCPTEPGVTSAQIVEERKLRMEQYDAALNACNAVQTNNRICEPRNHYGPFSRN